MVALINHLLTHLPTYTAELTLFNSSKRCIVV